MSANIIELSDADFWKEYNIHPDSTDDWQTPDWMGSRAFTVGQNVYINRDAFYLGDEDKQLVLEHEIGHTEGKKHALTGVMSPIGIIRYLTASTPGNIVLLMLLLWVLHDRM